MRTQTSNLNLAHGVQRVHMRVQRVHIRVQRVHTREQEYIREYMNLPLGKILKRLS